MAWQCSGRTHAELVANLGRAGYAAPGPVTAALAAVDRGWFTPSPRVAYLDQPVPLGYGATVSAPHMHAHALSALAPRLQPGAAVLDVGAGSGYLIACLAVMVGPGGTVVGVDHVPALVDAAERAVARARALVGANRMAPTRLLVADGRLGAPDYGPYDCIHVGAAAPGRPDALLAQLKPGGLLYVPEARSTAASSNSDGAQVIALYLKDLANNSIRRTELMDVRYVPLTDLATQLRAAA
jgi:protein-L-isoaspartate(D-aspartate) O-methyltransferase